MVCAGVVVTIRERIRALKAEAAQLETAASEEEHAQAYRDALQREREGVETALRAALALGDRRETVYAPLDPDGPWIPATKTGNETAVELERRLECIDWELRRVSAS